MLDAFEVVTALSTIRVDLSASIQALEWIVNAYNLTFAAMLMIAAALGDRLGRRRVFIAGIGIFTLGSLACALAASSAWLIGARIVQGLGAAFILPVALALLTVAFPPKERGRAFGIYGGITGMALVAGPVVGEVIAGGLAWQWIFWVNVPVGIALLPLVRGRMVESFGPREPLDVVGLLLVTCCAFGIVWGATRGNIIGWASTEVIVCLVSAVLLGLGFVFWELRCSHPMVPLSLFRIRPFWSGVVGGFCLSASLNGSAFFIAQFFQTAQGHAPLATGLRLPPWTAPLFFVAPVMGPLADRVGRRLVIAGGLFISAIGLAGIAWMASPNVSYVELIPLLVISGTGSAAAWPVVQNAVLSSVAPAEMGKASGTYNMFRLMGGVSGVAIMVAVFVGTGNYTSPEAFTVGFISAITAAAGLALAGAAVSLCQPRGRVQ